MPAMTARQYGKLQIQNWRDATWTTMTVDAQWLYAYLESQSSTNSAGVFPIQITKWARAAADMTKERVAAAAKLLHERRYIVVDQKTEEGLIRTHIRDDRAGENVFKGAIDIAAQTQSSLLRAVLLREIRGLGRDFSTRELELIDALESTHPGRLRFQFGRCYRDSHPYWTGPRRRDAIRTPSERRSGLHRLPEVPGGEGRPVRGLPRPEGPAVKPLPELHAIARQAPMGRRLVGQQQRFDRPRCSCGRSIRVLRVKAHTASAGGLYAVIRRDAGPSNRWCGARRRRRRSTWMLC
jgi:hypothetical protein